MASAASPPLALVVDDAPNLRRQACSIIEKELGWRTREAASGSDAMAALGVEAPSIVLTDLHMPDCDGLDLVEQIRARHPSVPVVLITSGGSEKLAIRALQRGAASYVPKRQFAAELADSLERVVAAAKATQNRARLLSFLSRVELHFDFENDPALIPVLVMQVQEHLAPFRFCDQNGVIRIGVALEEALLNGMYHGNLEVDSQLRQEDERQFHALIDERRRQKPYSDRRLHVQARLTAKQAEFSVADEGPGFDPSQLPDPTDPANLDTVGGRGLLLIRTFMDEVEFNEKGNCITLRKFRESGCSENGRSNDEKHSCK
jgi:CheY-like chemotaxis protein/anti-sigma regulatory factor (Ser/Thr protein kinase)